MQKRVMILTGSPGIGKTTVVTKTVDALKKQGYTVGDMVSREGGVRVGFWQWFITLFETRKTRSTRPAKNHHT